METWILIGSIVLLALLGGFGLVMNLITQPDMRDLQVTITNASALPVTDFGLGKRGQVPGIHAGRLPFTTAIAKPTNAATAPP